MHARRGKEEAGRIASLTPLVLDSFSFYFPRWNFAREKSSARWYSTGARSARGPRLHANNAIKRFEYRRDNALSTANSQPFLPLVRFAWKAGFDRLFSRVFGQLDDGETRNNRDTREAPRDEAKFDRIFVEKIRFNLFFYCEANRFENVGLITWLLSFSSHSFVFLIQFWAGYNKT